ncbi:ABC transporter ATP-binding protein [Acinetobacter oleivorans]|uniref:iron ABC transporter ATP-binding protein n=1 Tax=Acinetobacter TaxID=469 RepID=UPI000DCF8C8A|nr:ATP-binding cassette domain-containing protein [Acinetobacter oleivorans]MDV7644932.1 ATP-binding cassette domain-containing protein [Acinetobacter baumannii]
MIKVSNLSKLYGETIVVDNVSLDIPIGGVTAIIGPNGAGKSTLLSMISRLLNKSSGSVLIDNLNIDKTNTRELAKRLGILKQENHIPLRLTIRELVAFGRFPHSGGQLKANDEAHIQNSIYYMGLQDMENYFLDELSGGQRQRAFLAMVLCQDTNYILLDEPLNGLDMKHAVSMMKVLRKACDELGKTVVMVIHDLNFASCYADTIIAMKNGKVIHNGSPDELIVPDLLSNLYDTSVSVHKINGQRICIHYT